MQKRNPCYGCEDKREVGCHSWCKDYKKWKAQNEKDKKKKYLDKEYKAYLDERTVKHTGRR